MNSQHRMDHDPCGSPVFDSAALGVQSDAFVNCKGVTQLQRVSRVFAVGLFLSIVTVASGQVSQTSNKLEATSLYERAAPSVVVITSVDAAGQTSQGSGVVLRADGVIATNLHVIADAVSARIQLGNGDVYDDISVLDTDERRDIAILRVKAINLRLWLSPIQTL